MGVKAGSIRGPYEPCDGISYTGDGYRLIYAPQHPLASSVGQVLEHRMVLYDSIGDGPHPCHWCGKELDWGGAGGILADHIDEDKANNIRLNLVPACSRCNTRRSRGLPL